MRSLPHISPEEQKQQDFHSSGCYLAETKKKPNKKKKKKRVASVCLVCLSLASSNTTAVFMSPMLFQETAPALSFVTPVFHILPIQQGWLSVEGKDE